MSDELKTKIVITADSRSAVSAINATEQSVTGLSSSLKGLESAVVAAVGVNSLTDSLIEAEKAAAKYDKALVEIGTLSASAKANLASYRQEILALSVKDGQPLEHLTKGLYDSISAGVAAGDAMAFMGAASSLATAGVSSTAATVDLLTGVLNAYGKPASDAAQISDQLFATVQQGKTKIDDLAAGLGRVAPMMNAAGVSTAEMMAVTAELTTKLPNTSESITGLTALMASLARGNDELTAAFKAQGHESALAAIKAEGLGSALNILYKASGGSMDAMIKLIPEVTGANAALAAGANNAQGFSDKLKNIETSAGAATKAAKEIGETADKMGDKLKAAGEAAKVALGNDLAPAFVTLEKTVTGALEAYANNADVRDLTNNLLLVSAGALATAGALSKIIYPIEAYIVAQRAAAVATAASEAANLAAARSVGAYGAATASATTAVGLSATAILGYTAVIGGSVVALGLAAKGWVDWQNAEKQAASSKRAAGEALDTHRQKIHDYALAHVKTAGDVAHLTALVNMGIITDKEATAAKEAFTKTAETASVKQAHGAKKLTDEEKKELDKRLQALGEFNDRWLKSTLAQSAYELQAAQKQYAEDIKLAGANAALKIKALETYAAAAKKIDDGVAENLNKTRDAEAKKEADALGKLLDMSEEYSLETAKILVKQDETELKALEEKIKRSSKTNVISLAEYQQYQTALKSVTEKRFLAEEAAQEKSLIRMLENEKLTDAEREKIIAEHVARVAAIKGEKTAEEITALEGVTAAINDTTARQNDFWKTFEFNSTTMAELSKTAWTGIRDHIKESIKTAKLDVQGLGEFFKNTLIEMVATAAANQIVLSVAGAGGLVVSSAGNALAGQVVGQGAAGAVGSYTSGVGTFGAGAATGSGGFISGTAFAPGGWFGASPAVGMGPPAQGVFYTPGAGAGSGTMLGAGIAGAAGAYGGRYVGQQIGGNRETTNATGVAGGAAAGFAVGGPWGALIGAIAGLLMSNYGPGEGGPQGYDKYTAGGIGEIRNHPHDALATDTGLLAQHMATGNAMGASLVLKQIDELNTATSLLDQEYFKNTAAGQQMAASWTALTAEGATLADTIDRTGLNSKETAAGVEHMSASAQSFAMNAILGGQAGNELTASAVGIVASMNTAATATDKTLSSMASLADALYKAGENTWALSRAQGAAQVAQQMLNLSADLTYEQYQKLGQGAAELTKIEQRRVALMQELAAGVDATRFADIQKELIGLETASEGYIASISNVGTATEGAATGTEAVATGTDAAGIAAEKATPHTDALGKSYKGVGDYAAIAAKETRDLRLETERLRSLLNSDPGNTGGSSGDGSNDNPSGERRRLGSFGPVNDSTFYRGASSSPVIDMSGLTINIHAAPGMDVNELAAEFKRTLRQTILDESKRGITWLDEKGLFRRPA